MRLLVHDVALLHLTSLLSTWYAITEKWKMHKLKYFHSFTFSRQLILARMAWHGSCHSSKKSLRNCSSSYLPMEELLRTCTVHVCVCTCLCIMETAVRASVGAKRKGREGIVLHFVTLVVTLVLLSTGVHLNKCEPCMAVCT